MRICPQYVGPCDREYVAVPGVSMLPIDTWHIMHFKSVAYSRLVAGSLVCCVAAVLMWCVADHAVGFEYAVSTKCIAGLEEAAALESLNLFQPIPSGDHPPSSAPHRSATPPLHRFAPTPLCSPLITTLQSTNPTHEH